MSNELIELSTQELDTIGEIMNISMGSAATAISTMLDRPVSITTPHIRQAKLSSVDCSELEPAIMVKIKYIEGVDGTNVILLRRRDMQIILNLLMGNEEEEASDDFEFDEMTMSAACEVMNQMMGASATALSEVLCMPINISTPESILVEEISQAYADFGENGLETEVIAISFEMDISKILHTTFTSFWPVDMAKKIVDTVMADVHTEPAPAQPAQPNVAPSAATPSADAANAMPQMNPQMDASQMPQMNPQMGANQMPQMNPQMGANQMPQMNPQMGMNQMPQMNPQMGMNQMPQMNPQMGMNQMPQMSPEMMQQGYAYGQQNMMGMPAYPQNPWQMQGGMYGANGYPMYPQQQEQVNLQRADFPAFGAQPNTARAFGDSNMGLLMNIPLEVSVVIGKTKRKIRDIMDFGQGTVVELDKQTGAPAEIIVNGQLLAYGDVVVVDDNFGVRVTEIVGTEELLQSLTGKV